jgi:capsular polysaccharide export protein
VNARSPLKRDREWILEEARKLPDKAASAPITSSFKRRARDSYWHYHSVVTGRLRYPHYRSHRSTSIIKEGFGWLWKLCLEKRRKAAGQRVLQQVSGKPIFVFPLQLSGDFQIRTHSPFPHMQSAATYTIESFAKHAPSDVHLLIKAHPLDCSFFNWPRFVRDAALRLGLEGRLHFVDGGDLEGMARGARGLVCVNSTSATLALSQGTPVCTIGEAIYDMPGLTHQGPVDSFWSNPTAPEPEVYAAFKRLLLDRCLVLGGLASESAVSTLIGSILQRLGFEQRSLETDVARLPKR